MAIIKRLLEYENQYYKESINSDFTQDLIISCNSMSSLRSLSMTPAVLQGAPNKYNAFPSKCVILYGYKGEVYKVIASIPSISLLYIKSTVREEHYFNWNVKITKFEEYPCLKQYSVHSRQLPVTQITSDLMQLTFEELDLYE